MQLKVLGGWGGWPAAGGACSGYLLEHNGFRMLIDPGYAVVPKLLLQLPADSIDAVLVSHGHPDHCADINPLLRVRAFMESPPSPLPLFALSGALDAVLALDRPSMLGDTYELREFDGGASLSIGPFDVQTHLLPHPRPNAGFRIEAGGASMAYTGDAGPSADMVSLARGVDLLLAEASFAEEVPVENLGALSSARDAGAMATASGVAELVLTHLLPGTDRDAAVRAASARFAGPTGVAVEGLSVKLSRVRPPLASSFRRAMPSEADAVRALIVRSMGYWNHSPEYLAEASELMDLSGEDLQRDEAWMAEVGGETAGFYRLSREDNRFEIEEFHLEPVMIGRGIGRRMFEHAVDRVREAGGGWLTWSTDANTLGFYLHMGGEVSGEEPSGIAGDAPLTRMRLDLRRRPGPL